MSDNQEDSKGLVTITSDGMEALNTNGTNEIVPPDSPKRGNLFMLKTTVAANGEIEIQRTLVDEGEREDPDETSDAATVAEGGIPPEVMTNENITEDIMERMASHEPVLNQSIPELRQKIDLEKRDEESPEKAVECKTDVGGLSLKDEISGVVQKLQKSANESTLEEVEFQTKSENQDLKCEVQKNIGADKPEFQFVLQAEENVEPRIEVKTDSEVQNLGPEAASKKKMEEETQDRTETVLREYPVVTSKNALSETGNRATSKESASNERRESAQGVKGKDNETLEKEVGEREESKLAMIKPKRTMTLPIGSRLMPLRQKKTSVDHLVTAEKEGRADTTIASTTKTPNPFAVMLNNIKKGFKFKIGGMGKSSEDQAPGRIPQKSGSRPSPRIVSSLNITSTHQATVSAEMDTLTTRRRKELDKILSAMPLSPSPSVESVKDTPEASAPSHIYDNLPSEEKKDTVITPTEEEICPSVATKPPIIGLRQTIKEKKPLNSVHSMKSEEVTRTSNDDFKPPRPPPANNEQGSSSRPSPRNLPPPPRPPAPPKVFQRSHTMVMSSVEENNNGENVDAVSAGPLVFTEPVQLRSNYVNATTSLDRRKLYRSKAETKVAKRATLTRPITMHETTFTVKNRGNDDQPKSFDEGRSRLKSGQKVVFEQRDSITLPKFLLTNKRKSAPVPVSQPDLAASSMYEGDQSGALKNGVEFDDNKHIVSTTFHAQSIAPSSSPVFTSIAVQTAPQRPKPPVSSLHHSTSPFKTALLPPPSEGCLKIPFMGHQLAKKTKESEEKERKKEKEEEEEKNGNQEKQSFLLVFCQLHPTWSTVHKLEKAEAENESTSARLVNKCLKEYLASCARLRSVELQGDYAAFYWQYGNLSDAGWFKRGVLEGDSLCEVYSDPSKELDFLKLPQVHYSAGGIIYPQCTVDTMLSNWLDIGRTAVYSTHNQREISSTTEPAFHSVVSIFKLSNLLQELTNSKELQRAVSLSIVLATLLSFDWCSTRLSDSSEGDGKIHLNADPSEVILLSSPANCLVLFRVTDSDQGWDFQKLLVKLFGGDAISLQAAINTCIGQLHDLALRIAHLPALLLRGIAPPDWITQVIARSALGTGVKHGT